MTTMRMANLFRWMAAPDESKETFHMPRRTYSIHTYPLRPLYALARQIQPRMHDMSLTVPYTSEFHISTSLRSQQRVSEPNRWKSRHQCDEQERLRISSEILRVTQQERQEGLSDR